MTVDLDVQSLNHDTVLIPILWAIRPLPNYIKALMPWAIPNGLALPLDVHDSNLDDPLLRSSVLGISDGGVTESLGMSAGLGAG